MFTRKYSVIVIFTLGLVLPMLTMGNLNPKNQIMSKIVEKIEERKPFFENNYVAGTYENYVSDIKFIEEKNLKALSYHDLRNLFLRLTEDEKKLQYVHYNDVPQLFINMQEEFNEDIVYDNTRFTIVDGQGDLITDDFGEFSLHGNSTRGGVKPPYNINYYKEQDVLGINGRKWVLLADCFDATLMRNKYALDLSERIGLITSPHFRIEVWLNGNYIGLYLMTLKCDDKDLVPIDDRSTGEFLIEMDRINGNTNIETDEIFTTSLGIRYVIQRPNNIVSHKQTEMIKNKIEEIENTIQYDSYEDIQNIIDVHSFAKLYILNEYMKTTDFQERSVNFYFNDGKLYAGPPWDFDLSSGNLNVDMYGEETNSPLGEYNYKAHYCKYLFQHDEFKTVMEDEYRKIREAIICMQQNWFDDEIAQYRDAVDRNYSVYPPQYVGGNRYPDVTYEENVDYLRGWLASRFDWLDMFMNNIMIPN